MCEDTTRGLETPAREDASLIENTDCPECERALTEHGISSAGPGRTRLAPCGLDVDGVTLREVARLLGTREETSGPRLVADGGSDTQTCGKRSCDRTNTLGVPNGSGTYVVRCERHALETVNGIGPSAAATLLEAFDDLEELVEQCDAFAASGAGPVRIARLDGFGSARSGKVSTAIAETLGDVVGDREPEVVTDGGEEIACRRYAGDPDDWEYGDPEVGHGVPLSMRKGGASGPCEKIELGENGVAYESHSTAQVCEECGVIRYFAGSRFVTSYWCGVCGDVRWFYFRWDLNRGDRPEAGEHVEPECKAVTDGGIDVRVVTLTDEQIEALSNRELAIVTTDDSFLGLIHADRSEEAREATEQLAAERDVEYEVVEVNERA